MTENPVCDYCGKEDVKIILKNVQEKQTNLVECLHCGLRFFSPRPTWKSFSAEAWIADNDPAKYEANNLYENGMLLGYPPDVAKQKEYLINYYGGVVKTAEKLTGKTFESVLEIGCNVGWCLKACEKNGIKTLHGVDCNKYAVDIANHKMGLPGVVLSDFQSYQPNRMFSSVIMFDYLEHSYYPFTDLCRIASMVNQGGAIIIKTFLEELDTERAMLLPPHHAHHFFGHVLYKMINDAGFIIRQWQLDNKYAQVQIIAQRENNDKSA